MFFDWKIISEKVQLTRDLKAYTILYQGIHLPCKNDQGYCDPTTRTQVPRRHMHNTSNCKD